MTERNRIWLIITLLGAILAILLLAMGLSQVVLQPGSLFQPDTQAELRALLGQFGILRNFIVLLLIITLIVVVVLSLFLRSPRRRDAPPQTRNSTFGTLLRVFLIAIAIILLQRRLREGDFNLEMPPVEEISSTLPDTPSIAVNSSVPEGAAFIFSLALIILAGVIAWRIWRRRRPPLEPLVLLKREAEDALSELQAGADLRNVIVRCYYDMSQVLSEQRGIRRGEGMTPREFESRLVGLGLPQEPVQGLTRLFELARYGARDVGEQEERQARQCLAAIVQSVEPGT